MNDATITAAIAATPPQNKSASGESVKPLGEEARKAILQALGDGTLLSGAFSKRGSGEVDGVYNPAAARSAWKRDSINSRPAFSPDGKRVAVGSSDCSLYLLRAKSGSGDSFRPKFSIGSDPVAALGSVAI